MPGKEYSDAPKKLDPRVRRLYRPARRMAIATSPLGALFYDWQMRRDGVRAERLRVQLIKYPPSAPPLRAAFLSDLHYGPLTGTVALNQAWKIAREAQPDILFLGGDFLYADSRGLPALLRELMQWKKNPPPAGIFACLGNHDYLNDAETITTCLEACGVQVLVNRAAELPSPWEKVWIAGVDDSLLGKPDLSAALSQVPDDACAILLSHEPDICASSLLARCSLTLCGHTHGGQVCLPGGKPLWIGSSWSRDYLAGLYRHAGRWVYVSRGVGAVGLPLRCFAPPEVALLELEGAAQRGAVRVLNPS